ncbi:MULTISPECIES: Glu/Leu/Phe/Val dehydrogenase [Prauserella salsuginis group]|uniref:Valine dehydrogenase (NAD+) n=2 Tax=Prauserella salsuginis group TaxID=2893672 RepID=A0A839XZM4_9PSEU|nr:MULTISPECIES: Glu/Leu/Phe/Val dehydrogenase [Prauserella salsuginis group]MBB3665843.1 valine dehydrogenase (NAD+) [Prauserella sediminis]MCR3718827.1 valine dehydrogenase (NAD+) [Prauserella flava]MCR3733397.1 valine dehydrogenase (NAD+) [Prauserella salsuginis]
MTDGVFGRESGHEQVVYCHDRATGLKAIIAVYSTALGPALGGTRFYPYPDEDAALDDVLALSKGMAYKNALAGLDLGGGKAVIIGDPATLKTEALLRAYGRFIQSLSGRYITACDVGTYVRDMDIIARETGFVTGRSREEGGAGDSSELTAFGVYQGMRASAEHAWGSPELKGKRVGVEGVGKVGKLLVGHLAQAGAEIVITDVDEQAVDQVRAVHPSVEVVDDTAALIASDVDIFAPCALGGVLDDDTVPALRAAIVCGAANNQLAHPGVEKLLQDRGILFAPDYLVNAGGTIQVSDELRGYDADRARLKATSLYDTAKAVFALADEEGVPAVTAADRLAERRMSEVSHLRSILTVG